MTMINFKLRQLPIAAALLFSGGAMAATCPPIGTVQTLANPALKLVLQSPGKAFDAYDSAISMQLKIAFANIQNAVVDQNMQLAQTTMQAAELITKNQVEVQRLTSELKMNHEAYLEQTGKREAAALLTTGGGDVGKAVNKEYFAKLCALKKTSDVAFSSSGRNASLNMARTSVGEFEFSARGALLTFSGGNIVKKHYDKFCTEVDKSQGLCDEVAKIPNADLLSFVFLNPVNEAGKGVVKDIVMKTEYTYSDYEMSAAKSYIEHSVPSINIKKPPIGSELEPNMVRYTARYKQLQSMINMSRYVYTKAYNDRIPVIETKDLRLSRLDQMRVLLTKASTTDVDAVTNANAKGKMIFLLNQMALENMLDQEIAELEKLNNDLLATLLAEKNNTQEVVAELNNKRG